MPEPGLISRGLLGCHGDMAVVQEHWDVTVPGCPVIEAGTLYVKRTFRMPMTQWLELCRDIQSIPSHVTENHSQLAHPRPGTSGDFGD